MSEKSLCQCLEILYLLRFRQIIARQKGFRFDRIEAVMNTALEFINSPSSAAGPER